MKTYWMSGLNRNCSQNFSLLLLCCFATTVLVPTADAAYLEARFDWGPTYCQNKPCPDQQSIGAFTITDFVYVDDNDNELYNCPLGAAFDVKQIAPETINTLNCIFFASDGTNEELWQSTWEGSGRCTGLSIPQYFSLIAGLHQNLNVNKALVENKLGPPEIDAQTLTAAVKKSLGVTPKVACTGKKGLDYVALCVQPQPPFAVWDCSDPVTAKCSNGKLTMPVGQRAITPQCAKYFPYQVNAATNTSTPAPAPVVASPKPAVAPKPKSLPSKNNSSAIAPSPKAVPPKNTTGSSSTSSSSSSSDVGIIVGAVVGGVALLAVVAALTLFVIKKKKAKKNEESRTGHLGHQSKSGLTDIVIPPSRSGHYGAQFYGPNGYNSSPSNPSNAQPLLSSPAHSLTDTQPYSGSGGGSSIDAGAAAAAAVVGAGGVAMMVANSSNNQMLARGSNDSIPEIYEQQQPTTPRADTQEAVLSYPLSPTGTESMLTNTSGDITPTFQPQIGYAGGSTPRSAWSPMTKTPTNASFTSQSSQQFGGLLTAGSSRRRSSYELARDPILSYVNQRMPSFEQNKMERSTSTNLATWELNFTDLKIEKLIGEGSWGKVYKALWHESDCAVKILLDPQGHRVIDSTTAKAALESVDPMVQRLEQEGGLLASLHHPNVIQFLGVCAFPPAVVTEYCARGSLFEVMKKAKQDADAAAKLTWRRRISMAMDAAVGMVYLHDRQTPILHRDLKSPNLLVDINWRVKVADFNLSKIMEDTVLTQSTYSVSAMNPRWIGPEIIQGHPATKASDVFSFGVVLWELLTWNLPWGSSMNAWGIASNIIAGKRPPLPEMDSITGLYNMTREERAEFLARYIGLIQACWQQNAGDRPDFRQVIAELRWLSSRV